MCSETVLQSIGNATGVNVGDCDCGAARLARHRSDKKANSASTNDESGRSWFRSGAIDRMNRNRERL
jgi:hypothetical protein